MRANLLRSVSHDIRTPLTAIMGLSATVEESETLTDEGRGMVEEIHQNAQWLCTCRRTSCPSRAFATRAS